MRVFSRPGRPGFMLVLVPVLLLIVLAGLMIVNYLTRTQYKRGHSYRVGQEAAYLAAGASTMARAWLQESEGKKVLGRLVDLAVEQLESSPGAAVDLSEEVELPKVALLTAGYPGVGISTQVRLATTRPLRSNKAIPAGLTPDPGEAEALLDIVSECRWQGVTRKVRLRYASRLLNQQPPIVSKFALMVRESGALAGNVNCLEYDPASGSFRDAATGAKSSPVEVHPAPPDSPACSRARESDGRAASFASGLRNRTPAGDVGWTYLGGPDPWFLQLTAGPASRQPLEEQALLRRAAYVLPVSALGPEFQEKIYRSGFGKGVETLAMLGFAGSKWISPATGKPVAPRTAFMHLTGDADSAAPAVAIGPVFRRYIGFSKVRRGSSGAFRSFVQARDEAEYATVAEPFESWTGKGYADYRKVMARVIEEPYNRCYDYLVTSEEAQGGTGNVEAGKTPAVPPFLLDAGSLPKALGPADGSKSFLYPEPTPGPAKAAKIRISRGELLLFAGDPGRLDGYDDWMAARATREFPSTSGSFPASFLKGSFPSTELDLGGHVVRVKQACTVPGARVAGGGTVVADGDITVTGPIECAPGELLTLVSLKGSIKLATAGPVQAALVALKGQIRPPAAGGLEIRGAVACRNLDNFPEWLANPDRKKIVYNPELNWTSAEIHQRYYRLALTGKEERFLERH